MANPRDCITCMNQDGPMDPRFRIPNGTLLYNPSRDERLPYLYSIPTHELVHSPQYFKKILIHVVDTSVDDRTTRAKYEKTLSVPLGPNDLMEKYGRS